MTKIFAVAGAPVFHSKSPLAFNTAFRYLGIDAVYVRFDASTAEEVIAVAREIGMDGLNITSPFKGDVPPLLDEVDGEAERIGSVNTVVRRGGRLVGYNTDVAGVLEAGRSGGFDPSGKKAVVIGAGGAARAACLALVSEGARVVVVNRTFDKAKDAAQALGCTALPLAGAEDALQGAGLLVSAVSTRDRIIAPSSLRRGMVVLDANYGRPSALVEDARQAGCTLVDGREWLLGQALPAFRLFTGREAPVVQMRKALWKRRLDRRRNIALIGFSGTGKSSVAEHLASLSGMTFVDIDAKVEEEAGASISEIFATRGEEAFRRMEQARIEEVGLDSGQVVSCGGGAVMNRSNVRVLRNNCISVWLWAEAKTALQRIGRTGGRPLLASSDPQSAASALLAERIPFYARTSDLLINTKGRGPLEVAQRIWDEIDQAFSD